jgi:hypothetical protein
MIRVKLNRTLQKIAYKFKKLHLKMGADIFFEGRWCINPPIPVTLAAAL